MKAQQKKHTENQKNMTWLSITLVVVNLIFLCLGVLLYDYADAAGITETGDKLYPAVALSGGLGLVVAVFFIIGLIAAAYSSADSALTALTTSFCVDFLDVKKMEAGKGKRVRKQVHIAFSLVLLLVILVFKYTVDESVIKELFVAAGYTYGPLLGLYAFGLFSKLNVRDKYVPIVAVIAPILSFILKSNSKAWFNYEFGFELLIVNGLLTYGGLLLLTTKKEPPVTEPRVA